MLLARIILIPSDVLLSPFSTNFPWPLQALLGLVRNCSTVLACTLPEFGYGSTCLPVPLLVPVMNAILLALVSFYSLMEEDSLLWLVVLAVLRQIPWGVLNEFWHVLQIIILFACGGLLFRHYFTAEINYNKLYKFEIIIIFKICNSRTLKW